MLKLPSHGRYDHSNITARPDYSWPDGKRLAFYVALNIEHFAFGAGLGMDPTNRGGPQTTRNWAWRDYGNRVGNWRLFEILRRTETARDDFAEQLRLLPLSRHRQ